MQGPDERLRERLARLPDACRAILAALDRAKLQGGATVMVRLCVDGVGRVRWVKVGEREYSLRAG